MFTPAIPRWLKEGRQGKDERHVHVPNSVSASLSTHEMSRVHRWYASSTASP